MDQKKIGKFIAVRRREAGMTQQALSERLGVCAVIAAIAVLLAAGAVISRRKKKR